MLGHIVAAVIAVIVFIGLKGTALTTLDIFSGVSLVWLVVLPFSYVVFLVLWRGTE